MNRNLLVKGIELVGVLFAAFGGFLVGVAPPQAADAKFAVGISSFLCLIILFTIASLSKMGPRKAWVITAVCLFVIAVVGAYYYKVTRDSLTFEYPPGNANAEYVAGTELTPLAQAQKGLHPGISNSQLLAGFGGLQNRGKVWPDSSVNRARTKLVASYMVLVIALASSIFALSEGALVKVPSRKYAPKGNAPVTGKLLEKKGGSPTVMDGSKQGRSSKFSKRSATDRPAGKANKHE